MSKASKVAVLAGLATMAIATATDAAPPMIQPPMNSFLSAYYKCDDNAAFNMAYEERRPKTAQMTVSPDSTRYNLKRIASADSVILSDGKVTFTTDGETTVTVEGAATPLQNCKLQN